MREVLVDLRDAVMSLKKENRGLMNLLGDADLRDQEQKGDQKQQGSDALMIRVSKLEKELVAYKRVMKYCVVVVVVLVCMKWMVS